MSANPTAIDVFQHIRVVMSIVLGLGLTRLLTGLARFIQHPSEHKAYSVHIGWALTMLLFFLCTLLFPDSVSEYSGYEGFFISRRKWFFSIFAATILFDVADTMIKGPAHYAAFATEYLFRVPAYLVLCAVAIWTPNRRFHRLFVAGSLVYQITWITRLFNSLS